MKSFISFLFLALTPFTVHGDGLESARESVRGDTGKWNDNPILQFAPPPGEKPEGLNLDNWADQLLENPVTPQENEETWLLFRTRQLDDNDRVWVEKVEREGNTITVRMSEAIWKGNYFKTFTYYEVLLVNLGKLPAGEYTLKWVVEPFVFSEFDGDGRPQARNGKPQNWPENAEPGKGEAKILTTSFEVPE
jgi:hypothetical protein